MLKLPVLPVVLMYFMIGCSKSETPQKDDTATNGNGINISNKIAAGGTDHDILFPDTFTTYIIRGGQNFCENNSYAPLTTKRLKFKAIFDSSCIYTNVDPNNQADINKLYGFADSNSFHQINSARFGWNWMDGKMHIHAYTYVSALRIYKELGIVELNKEIDCTLEVIPGKYIFTLNGKRDTMLRASMDTVAAGYKLLPYFGGDEPAPHDIRIKIKEVKN